MRKRRRRGTEGDVQERSMKRNERRGSYYLDQEPRRRTLPLVEPRGGPLRGTTAAEPLLNPEGMSSSSTQITSVLTLEQSWRDSCLPPRDPIVWIARLADTLAPGTTAGDDDDEEEVVERDGDDPPEGRPGLGPPEPGPGDPPRPPLLAPRGGPPPPAPPPPPPPRDWGMGGGTE